MCQDKFRQLWIGTEGGISKFDGKKFTGYSVQDGLVTNRINMLIPAANGELWIATNSGLSAFNGKKFTNIRSNEGNNFLYPVELDEQHFYVINSFKLNLVKDYKLHKQIVTNDTNEKITTLYKTTRKDLLAAVYGDGIYALANGQWKKLYNVPSDWRKKSIRDFFITSRKDTLLMTNTGLYRLVGGNPLPFIKGSKNFTDENVLCLEEDAKANLWLGTDKGVFKIEENKVVYFNAQSGFTDNSTNQILRDSENNLWFATDADGIYKFRENTFTYYDKSSGMQNTIIMGVAQTGNRSVFAAGYGGGLYKVNPNNTMETVKNIDPVLAQSRINCLYADDENNVWVGTINKGVWKYNEKKGAQKIEQKNTETPIKGSISFLKDVQGNLLIGSNPGLFVLDKESNIRKINIANNISITSFKQFNADCVMVGTSRGIYFLDKNYRSRQVLHKDIQNTSILCLAKQGENVWVGTSDKGVINWNVRTAAIKYYNTLNGLPSNFIYSIDVSNDLKAWVGTGFGISNLQLDDKGDILAIKNFGRSDGLLGMECSHNGILKSKDSSLWFGTTKGLFHFNPSSDITEKNKPLVLLKSVKLFSSDISDSSLFEKSDTWFNVPQGLILSSKQNHLTFELGFIYFTNPDDIIYKYKLEGVDKEFTSASNPFIIYPALPPGKYNLNIQAVTKNGVKSLNEINYNFTINKAFYQTRFFQIMVILLLLLTGGLIAYVLTKGRQKRRQRAKEQLEKIREEEFLKLRERTAEDFHDEMGNSLTRISVLSDVLKTKINKEEKEVTHIIEQIKENTSALYNGSRDIIWSLNAQNDGLYQVVEHLKDIGIELFQDTEIEFTYNHNVSPQNGLKLKLDYSRNLTMVFKEMYSNILKHARATQVKIDVDLQHQNQVTIRVIDNGLGFDINRHKSGNGLRNIASRVKRLGGDLDIISKAGKGTELHITLNNIFA